MSMLNPLARARGKGSAKRGVDHWFAQRASAVLLLFLVAWLVYAMVNLAGADYEQAAGFVGRPHNAALMALTLVTLLYHAVLGLQVVIEDYVHQPASEFLLHFLVRAGALLGGIYGLIIIIKLALGA